jgi:transcriptional regulator with XRE-family HTH domain
MPDSRMARADRRTHAALARLGDELPLARRTTGLTLAQVSVATGISISELSRVELGDAPWMSVAGLGRIAAAVGLDVWLRAYPGGEPVRDIAHIRLSDAFRALLGPDLVIRVEVPIGDGRDLRAGDMTLTDRSRSTCGVEFETRFVDAQGQLRRLNQKTADGGVDRVMIVVADTRANRLAVRAAAGMLASSFAVEDPEAIEALASGRVPPRDAVLLVRVRAKQRREVRDATF